MIKHLDETIKRVIHQKAGFSPEEVEIAFDQPTGTWANALTRPTLNCYLYDIRENLDLRNYEVTRESLPEGKIREALSPMWLDLTYIITAWTTVVEDEHEILWRAIAALANTNPIPWELCEEPLKAQPVPIETQTAQVTEALSNLSDLWNVMDNQLKPAFNHRVTLAMDRDLTVIYPMVLTKQVSVHRQAHEPRSLAEYFQVGGVVFRKKTKQPIAEAEIISPQQGITVKSDEFGRYKLSSLERGEHRLHIRVDEDMIEKTIEVPSREQGGVYDLAI
ncbi:MAG: hypothetical protein NPIRA04_04740 [Nitrospirales bacterium]|nr:MAG: hypothetical protein NPIRA04_04740 [Nitrospirales bacterium]